MGNSGNIILTGDRPTGKLHLGHYVGSLRSRVAMQEKGDYDRFFVMIADTQALTDNAHDPEKIRQSLIEVALDYLAVGIDPDKVTIFVQSQVPQLFEMTAYYMNLVTVARAERNPTVKAEIAQKGFGQSIPMGFLNYPISQAADITAFKANVVPVGEDQEPMLEQCREIVRSFNGTYGREVLVEPHAVIPEGTAARLPGIDGKAKMSKSLGNGIYLSDDPKTLHDKVFDMYTDPGHLRVSDPGKVEGNAVFTYLDAFSETSDFAKYLPEFKDLDELKDAYRAGGVGDVKVKKLLLAVLTEELEPIWERRARWERDVPAVYDILKKGSADAREAAQATLDEMRSAMGIDYFADQSLIDAQAKRFAELAEASA